MPKSTAHADAGARVAALDLLRAVAVVMVIAHHMPAAKPGDHGQWLALLARRAGWSGVDLFFVLSGFLVSGLLFREHRASGRIDVPRFYLRRGLKIYPAFYVFVGCSLAFLSLAGVPHPPRQILAECLFFQNYRPGLPGVHHTWSLAVEEHFYLAIPLVLLALARRRPRAADPFAAIPLLFVVVAIVELLLRLENTRRPFSVMTHHFATHLRVDALLLGVLLSYLVHYRQNRFLATCGSGWRRLAMLATGMALVLPCLFEQAPEWFMPTVGLTLTYLGYGLVLAFAVSGGEANRHWPTRAAASVGANSYSIYLWHYWICVQLLPPLLVPLRGALGQWTWLAGLGLLLGMSVLLGTTMAKLVEAPALCLRDRLFPSRAGQLAPRRAAATVASPVSTTQLAPVPPAPASRCAA